MRPAPLLEVIALKKHFAGARVGFGRRPIVYAVDDVSFTLERGETLSIVGESGCGKSTLGRTILGLIPPTEGAVWFDGWRLDQLSRPELRKARRHFQVVFQDPLSSLNPRMRVREIIAEPLLNFGIAKGRSEIDARVADLLDMVALPRDAMGRLAHEFSGGQRQRICIARALASGPSLIVCDEAVSALDVSVKAQIVNLLSKLQQKLNMSMLFISHDLAVVEHLTHRVAVMYLGVIVELGRKEQIFSSPKHPYTRALISSVPIADPEIKAKRIALYGEPPSPIDPPKGCRFHTRCPYVFDRCRTEQPKLRPLAGERQMVACHLDPS